MPVTSIQEWRTKNAPEEVELPSGNVVKLRKVHLLEMARDGEIPATLATMISNEGKINLNAADLLSKGNDMADLLNMIDAISIKAFAGPKLGKEATDDQLGLDEVDVMDRMFVFRWCNRGAEQLKPFRPEQDASVESAPDGQDVRDEAECDPGS